MLVIDSIKNNFNKGYFGKAMRIEGLPNEYPAWTLKQQNWYGVAVAMDRKIDFSEYFSTAHIWTSNGATIEGRTENLLLLTCSDVELRNEFATICSQFVETSADGVSRKRLITDPIQWWSNWKSLIGNAQAEREVYSIIGELLVIEKLLQEGKHPKWSGIESATHDIELDDRSYEVKSTIKRYGYEVEISSIYQMRKEGERLDLVFFRFERSQLGRSLDDVVKSIISLGYPKEPLENALNKEHLEKGCIARSTHYKLLEMRVYPVDENFPTVTLDSFVGGKLPANVIKFKYTLDLSGVNSRSSL